MLIAKNRLLQIFILFILWPNIVSCGYSYFKDDNFSKKVSATIVDYLNIEPLVRTPIKMGTVIDLYVANKTTDCIVFPYNYGLQIYTYKGGDWIEIPDTAIYMTKDNVTLDAKGSLFPDAVVSVSPDYSYLNSDTQTQRLRIVLIGHLCKSGFPSEKTVADYVDLNIQP